MSLHKDSGDWLRGAQKIQVKPQQLLAIGDNITGDVQAAVYAGFGQVVWIDKKSGWKLYRQGQIPPGVHVVQSIGELLTLTGS